MSLENAPTGTPVECLVGQFRKDVYDEVFDLLRTPREHKDSVDSHARIVTDRIVAYAGDIIERMLNVQN